MPCHTKYCTLPLWGQQLWRCLRQRYIDKYKYISIYLYLFILPIQPSARQVPDCCEPSEQVRGVNEQGDKYSMCVWGYVGMLNILYPQGLGNPTPQEKVEIFIITFIFINHYHHFHHYHSSSHPVPF